MPKVSCRVQSHHVGGGLGAVAPELHDGQALLVGHDGGVGRAQPTRCFQQAHRARHLGDLDTADHRGGCLGVDLGTVRQQCGVEGDQFLGAFRIAPQQLGAEPSQRVHLQDQIGQLDRPDHVLHRLSGFLQFGLLSHCLHAGDPHAALLVNLKQALAQTFLDALQAVVEQRHLPCDRDVRVDLQTKGLAELFAVALPLLLGNEGVHPAAEVGAVRDPEAAAEQALADAHQGAGLEGLERLDAIGVVDQRSPDCLDIGDVPVLG
jgi:hypothetical protein